MDDLIATHRIHANGAVYEVINPRRSNGRQDSSWCADRFRVVRFTNGIDASPSTWYGSGVWPHDAHVERIER